MNILDLNFNEFDQTVGSGWRKLENAHAAIVIDEYLSVHSNHLEDYQKIVLNFHSGQCYACCDSYDIAVERMRKSININNIEWNYYVCGTIGFLRSDFYNLMECSKNLSIKNNDDGVNARILKRLINGWGSRYKEVY